jgi:alginate O-acetyltransferase complex protein AlgI
MSNMPDTLLQLGIATIIALPIYYLLPRRAQNVWLLLVSLGLYAFWSWRAILLLLGIAALNYWLAQKVEATAERPGKWWTAAGIVANIGSLIGIKYLLVDTLPRWTAAQPDVGPLLIPIGYSFITLQLISYLVDVFNRRIQAEHSFIDFALYLMYFPKIIAGPIERAGKFLPALKRPRVVDNSQLERSFALIIFGIVRKVVCADVLLRMLNQQAFDDPLSYGGPALALALLTYSLLIYNDFAGYSNIVRGISGLFGINLTMNFRQPYLARNVSDFWARWHISFSEWLRDYIFFPLSRSLAGRWRNRNHVIHFVLPPLAAMVVSALWHEMRWHMLGWGLLHALYLILRRYFQKAVPASYQTLVPYQIISTILTFLLVALAWVPFRAGTTSTLIFWSRLFTWANPTPVSLMPFIPVILSFALDAAESSHGREPLYMRWPRLGRAAALAVALLLIAAVAFWPNAQAQTFIYQGF